MREWTSARGCASGRPRADARRMFAGLTSVAMDQILAPSGTSRREEPALVVARLITLLPGLRRVGLPAAGTCPAAIRAFAGADAPARPPVADRGRPFAAQIVLPSRMYGHERDQ